MAYKKTLFEMQKGKQMQASGTWKATKAEDIAVKIVAAFFTVSVLAVLVSAFLGIKLILIPAIICLAVSFVGMFVVMFGIVFLKARKAPMEKHYYSVDYKYDGIKDELTDHGREISRDEFFGNTEPKQKP